MRLPRSEYRSLPSIVSVIIVLGCLVYATRASAVAALALPVNTSKKPVTHSVLSGAALNITDQLDLVSAGVFSGAIEIGDSFAPDVFISSTLPASKPSTSSSTKYQDAEILLPQSGVLNLLFSYSSVNLHTVNSIPTNIKNGVGRNVVSDRLYFGDIRDIASKDSAQAYLLNGAGIKLLNRNTDTTASSNVSNYGVGGIVYLGLGVDGAFVPVASGNSIDAAGNYRIEAYVDATYADSVSIRSMYPAAKHVSEMNYGVGCNLLISITSKLGVNLQAGWPLGSSRGYMGKIILVGITLNRSQG